MLLMEKYWVSKTPLNHESRKWTEIWNNRKYWNKNLIRRKIRLKHHRGKLELAKWTQTWRKSDSKGFKEWLMSLKKGGLELCLLAVILAWATVPLIVCTLFFYVLGSGELQWIADRVADAELEYEFIIPVKSAVSNVSDNNKCLSLHHLSCPINSCTSCKQPNFITVYCVITETIPVLEPSWLKHGDMVL